MSIFNEIVGVNKNDEKIVLSDLLTVSTLVQAANDVGDICMMLAFMNENGVAYENTASFKEGNVLRDGVELFPGDSHYVFVKVDMDENIANEANAKDKNSAPSIEFGVNVLATQLSYENDSFGKDYDGLATYMNKNAEGQWEIATLGQLIYFAQSVNSGASYYEGEEIILTADIDLAGINWTPIGSMAVDHGFMGDFDGNGYKIKNLTIVNPALDADGYAYAGFFGLTEGVDKNNQNSIKNLVIENVTISTEGHIAAGAIAYSYYTALENITVCGDINIKGGDYTAGALAYTRRCVDAKNVTVKGNAGSTIIGGNTVGGVISDIQMNGGLTANYSNFKASNVTVVGEKSVGGISGIIGGQTLDGATVENVTLVCNDAHVGIVSGAYDGKPVINNATYSNVSGATGIVGAPYGANSNGYVYIDGVEYVGNAAALKEALAAGKNVILANDITVDVIGTAFTVERGVSVKIDLNGHNIIATSTSAVNVELFNVSGTLEIVGNGAVALTGKNFGWNNSYRYTTINIRETGEVTLGEGVAVLCKASNGADYGMNYAVDIYKDGVLNINGATLYSNYIVVRCFYGAGVVNVGAGSEIIGTHDNGYGIWLQNSPSATVTVDSSVPYTFDGSTLYYF